MNCFFRQSNRQTILSNLHTVGSDLISTSPSNFQDVHIQYFLCRCIRKGAQYLGGEKKVDPCTLFWIQHIYWIKLTFQSLQIFFRVWCLLDNLLLHPKILSGFERKLIQTHDTFKGLNSEFLCPANTPPSKPPFNIDRMFCIFIYSAHCWPQL